MSEETAALAPAPTAKTDKDQKKMRDILTAYRLTGVTMFNVSEFEESDWSKYNMPDFPVGPKEIGIRFETFADGKYHEPYYIMITSQATSRTGDDQEDQDSRTENGCVLKISKHTIPHWIPLRDIEKRYLNQDMTTFTRIVSERLQEFVAKRENGRQIAQDDTTMSEHQEQ
ncbi:hypothetical protein BGX26_001486 [Mortierella sp. AD094]|nr:hypothetical protein BGX26_001486 [Mortierella sp. AD094]